MVKNIVVILGMTNSGEGELVESLAKEGVDFGDQELLTQFNRHCAPVLDPDGAAHWKNHPMTPALRRQLDELLVGRTGIRGIHVNLVPLYQEAFDRLGLTPTYKICVRDPIEMIRTLRWDGMLVPQLEPITIGIWLKDTLGAFEAVGDSPFEVVLLGELLEHEEAPKLFRDALKLCRSFNRERLTELLREFRIWQSMLAPVGNPGTQAGFAWVYNGVNQVVQVPFLPNGDWQTMKMKVDAPPDTRISGLLYGRPCQVWIRRCEWGPNQPAQLFAGPGSQLSEHEGMLRLDGAYESQQLSLRTPSHPGPFALEIEFLLEASYEINVDTAERLSKRLNQCAAKHLARQKA